MKFFKHFTDAHRGNSLQNLFEHMGHVGIACYWILVEMCAEKLEKGASETFEPEHCVFQFHEKILRQNLRVSRTNVELFLGFCAGFSLLSFKKSEQVFEISMPKLLESMDRDTKRARTVRVMPAPKKKRKNKEKEEEREKEDLAQAPLPPLAILWNENCGDLAKVTKTSKARNRKALERYTENSAPEWVAIIQRVARSSFCVGKNDRGWKATFDWLLQPDTHLKVSEGKYDNRDSKPAVERWEQTATRVLNSLLKRGTGSRAALEIESDLGPDLYKLVIRAGTQRIRDLPRGPHQIRNIAEMLQRASEAMGGAA